jgi:hypothetical protein
MYTHSTHTHAVHSTYTPSHKLGELKYDELLALTTKYLLRSSMVSPQCVFLGNLWVPSERGGGVLVNTSNCATSASRPDPPPPSFDGLAVRTKYNCSPRHSTHFKV